MSAPRLKPEVRLVYASDRACVDLPANATHVLLGIDRHDGRVMTRRYVTTAAAKRFCDRHALALPAVPAPGGAVVEPLPVATQRDSAQDHHDFRARAAGEITQPTQDQP